MNDRPDAELDAVLQRPTLRADLLTPVVHAPAGQSVAVAVQVLNTGSVIEQVDVRMLGLMAESVTQTPQEITLFPEESLRIILDLRFHETLPTGSHEATLVISGRSGSVLAAELDVTVEVPPNPQAQLRAEPPIRTAGKRGVFDLLIDNTGNTDLDLLLQATDANRVLDLSLSHRKINLRPDQKAYASLIAHHKRPWTGSPVEHVITVTAEGGQLEEATELRFRQKAKLTAGVITILTLALIVLLWALAMLFGVQAALAPPEPTRSVPENFMQGTGADDLDPAVVGGEVGGSIVAASTGQGIPNVTVEAFDAAGELVSATATDDDGSYEVAGLLPTRHRLRIRATGYETVWWPGVRDAMSAGELLVPAQQIADAGATTLSGQSGAIGGQVVAGDGVPVTTEIELIAIDLEVDEPPVTATTDEQGSWSAEGLTAPATYRVTYTAPGYAPVELTESLTAGEQLVLNTVRLPAAAGSIAGRVVDRDGSPVGGAEVVARFGDTELTTTTPTSGEVGSFTFEELETPGTYLLTFSADGFASETQGVRLEAGQSVSEVVVTLSAANGTVRGRVTSSSGDPLGGVQVTVSGGGAAATTETLTSGDVGSFRLADLPLPGVYTVTFDADGYTRESVQVSLDAESPEGTANGVLTSSVSRITGVVLDEDTGEPIAGADVEVSDGSEPRTTTTASAPAAQAGRFSIGGLAPGSYTVTVRVPGGGTLTVLETLEGAEVRDLTLEVAGP